MRGQRHARPISYAPDPQRFGRNDNYGGAILNYGIPVVDGNYYPMQNLRDPHVENTGRGFTPGVGTNWPQTPLLYGSSVRTGASPVAKRGGALQTGAPNANRWTTTNLQAYLASEGMARRAVYSPQGQQ